ncbi:MAG: DUF805 domain-containing protein [Actinomyces bowdenii]|nr:DUF805 domain-containing protein [Actinomyces bowdenii]
MSYGNTPDPYGAQPQQGYPQQPGGFPGQPGGMPGGYGAGGYQFGAPALSPEVAPLPGASIGDAVKRFFQRYAQFRGYASQSEYWWVFLFLAIIHTVGGAIALAPLFSVLVTISPNASEAEINNAAATGAAGSGILMMIYFLVALALLVPTLSLSVRRLHDAGYSGWLVLISLVLSWIAYIVFGLLRSRPEGYRPEWS